MLDPIDVLSVAIDEGQLKTAHAYGKSDLIGAVPKVSKEFDGNVQGWFTKFRRRVANGIEAGGLSIVVTGKNKGTKYTIFRGSVLEAKSVEVVGPLETPTVDLSASESVANPSEVSLNIWHGDNLEILTSLPNESFDLIYIDPPFNTGKTQARTRIKTVKDSESGDRVGFQGERYRTIKVGTTSYNDSFDDFIEFIEPRLIEARRLLKPSGNLFFHIDYREVHYCKVLLDTIFGRDCFQNEIIWAYDYGGRSKSKWSAKHDNILWYSKEPKGYQFNFEEMDRIPYMAPGLVGPEKAARGKTPTDVWWHTIVPTNGKERTGYATQKPLGILKRIIKVHTNPGGKVLDFFAGSGTTGDAAIQLGRNAVLIDQNPEALEVMSKRLAYANPTFHGFSPVGEADVASPQRSLFVNQK